MKQKNETKNETTKETIKIVKQKYEKHWCTFKHKEDNYKNYEVPINERSYYRVCVNGAKAKKGGKQCAEYYLEKGSIINFYIGGQESGGKRGYCKKFWNSGYGCNGGRLSKVEYRN